MTRTLSAAGRRGAAAGVLAAVAVAVVASCDDDGSGQESFADVLCPTVQAWSDSSVDVVDDFRIDSRGLDAAPRRARYQAAFTELEALRGRLVDAIDDLDLPGNVADALQQATDTVAGVIDDGATEAEALPDRAFRLVAVRDGSLVTGVEKAKAVVFQALSDLAEDAATGVPRGCGRRGALDLSPSATFPTSP